MTTLFFYLRLSSRPLQRDLRLSRNRACESEPRLRSTRTHHRVPEDTCTARGPHTPARRRQTSRHHQCVKYWARALEPRPPGKSRHHPTYSTQKGILQRSGATERLEDGYGLKATVDACGTGYDSGSPRCQEVSGVSGGPVRTADDGRTADGRTEGIFTLLNLDAPCDSPDGL